MKELRGLLGLGLRSLSVLLPKPSQEPGKPGHVKQIAQQPAKKDELPAKDWRLLSQKVPHEDPFSGVDYQVGISPLPQVKDLLPPILTASLAAGVWTPSGNASVIVMEKGLKGALRALPSIATNSVNGFGGMFWYMFIAGNAGVQTGPYMKKQGYGEFASVVASSFVEASLGLGLDYKSLESYYKSVGATEFLKKNPQAFEAITERTLRNLLPYAPKDASLQELRDFAKAGEYKNFVYTPTSVKELEQGFKIKFVTPRQLLAGATVALPLSTIRNGAFYLFLEQINKGSKDESLAVKEGKNFIAAFVSVPLNTAVYDLFNKILQGKNGFQAATKSVAESFTLMVKDPTKFALLVAIRYLTLKASSYVFSDQTSDTINKSVEKFSELLAKAFDVEEGLSEPEKNAIDRAFVESQESLTTQQKEDESIKVQEALSYLRGKSKSVAAKDYPGLLKEEGCDEYERDLQKFQEAAKVTKELGWAKELYNRIQQACDELDGFKKEFERSFAEFRERQGKEVPRATPAAVSASKAKVEGLEMVKV